MKIVGLPEPIAEPKEMKRSGGGYDFAEVEFVIHVGDPAKCDFNLGEMEHLMLEQDGALLLENGQQILMENA